MKIQALQNLRCAALILCLALVGCEGRQFGARETGALGGAAAGAGLGAIVGHQVGHAGAGVAIGSAFGALTGALIGNSIDNTNDSMNQNEARLAEQERQLQENRRLIDELRRRGTDARITDRGVVVNLPDVLFEFGKSNLTAEARSTAREIASVIQSSPGRRISVEGHTDSIGTIEFNQRLSEDRARSVASQLVSEGVPRGRIATHGFGESRPIASNKTDAGRQRNRRVEVVIENR
ncbi:MAG: OmpA family protein [Oligoflexia bacterium]|nr:OmpA family protein [Oligoflexia bacterium]